MRILAVLISACLSSDHSPSRNFFINRANMFKKSVEFELPGKSREQFLGPLNFLFHSLLRSKRSDRFLKELAVKLEGGWRRFNFGQFKLKSLHQYFHSISCQPEPCQYFGVDMLAFANVNVLETPGWIADPHRQKLLARLLALASRVGIPRSPLARVFYELDKLNTSELQQRILDIENQVAIFKQTSSVVSFDIFGPFLSNAETEKGSFLQADLENTVRFEFSAQKSILVPIALTIHTEARIGILPQLLLLIDCILVNSKAEQIAIDSSTFIFMTAIVNAFVDIANTPSHHSMVALTECMLFVKQKIHKYLESFPESVFLFAEELFTRFGVRFLDIYPTVAQSLGWSQEKSSALQRLIIQFSACSISRSERDSSILKMILNANATRLTNAGNSLGSFLSSYWKMQSENIFIEPLVDPQIWVLDLVQERRFALWMVKTQPSLNPIPYPNTHNNVPYDVAFSIKQFLGFPRRFVQMSMRISRILEQFSNQIQAAGCYDQIRDVLQLPRKLMKKEVDWDIIEESHSNKRMLLEETTFTLIEIFEILGMKQDPRSIHPWLPLDLHECIKSLRSFLNVEKLPDLNEPMMQRILSQSDQLRSWIIANQPGHTPLCRTSIL